jgi:hypothetical protein
MRCPVGSAFVRRIVFDMRARVVASAVSIERWAVDYLPFPVNDGMVPRTLAASIPPPPPAPRKITDTDAAEIVLRITCS